MYYRVINFVIYIVMLLITIVLIKSNGECVVRISSKHIFQQSFTGLALAFILILSLMFINVVWFHSFSPFQFLRLSTCARVNFFTFQLLVGVTEELFFRVYLLCVFKKITNSLTGAIFSSAVLFAGIHLVLNQDPVQFAVALIIGLLFAVALVYYKSCSIYSLIIAHVLYNLAVINV